MKTSMKEAGEKGGEWKMTKTNYLVKSVQSWQ